MAIAYRAGSTAGNATGGDLTVTKPSGTADGDIIVAACYNESGINAWTAPAGWARWGTGKVNFNNNSWIDLYWKRASGEGANYVFLITTTFRTIAMASFSGGLASGDPIDVGPTGDNADTNIPSVNDQTTITDGAMMVATHGNFAGAALSYTSGTSLSAGANLGGCEIWYGVKTPAGGTGSTLWNGVMVHGDWASFHFAIKPAAATTFIAAEPLIVKQAINRTTVW